MPGISKTGVKAHDDAVLASEIALQLPLRAIQRKRQRTVPM